MCPSLCCARTRCVDGLLATLTQMYSDQEPSKVLLLTEKVASVFAKGKRFADSAELEELKQLKADAQVIDECVICLLYTSPSPRD